MLKTDKEAQMLAAAAETLAQMQNPGPKRSAIDKAVESRIQASQGLRAESIGQSYTVAI